ncbi:SMC family ATPase [Halomonas sp. Bachu 37]|uniref:SMC family ATPase n=1 Tax=Halomonas kashgarensis TaxID=3084920 RepID=UPI0032173964
MTPLTLTMQAFGPFTGSETIDFTALGKSPLFLINGPTGAGKSSILDALCFALYGQTTGDERTGTQMRCDQAAAGLLTEVTFDFNLRGEGFRVRRVPQQERPKARGEGTTTQNAEAQLWRLTPQGEVGECLVARSVNDATAEVQTLIGLDANQFRQVMVLPQGKFRELLLADSKDREKIFSQLFQTQLFQRIEERLRTQANQIEREVNDHRQRVKGILDASEVESEAELEETLQNLEPQKLNAERAYTEAKAQREQAEHAERQGNESQALFERHKTLEAAKTEQLRHQPEAERAQAKLHAHEQTQVLTTPFYALQTAQQAVATSTHARETAEAAITARQSDYRQAQQALESAKERQAQLPAWQKEAYRLEHAVEQCQELASLEAQRERLASQAAQTTKAIEQQQGDVTALERRATEQELRWHQGQAALLAQRLETDRPCPVCGSCEHPAPAGQAQALVTQDDVKKVRDLHEKARRDLITAQQQAQRQKLGMTHLDEQCQRLRRQLGDATSLDALQAQHTNLQRDIHQCERAWQAAQQQAQQAQTALARAETTLNDAAQRETLAGGELAKAQQAWRQALADSDFNDEAAFADAHLPEAERQALAERVEHFQRELAKLEGQLEASAARLEDLTPPDLDVLAEQTKDARVREQASEQAYRQLASRVAQLQATRQKLAAAQEAQAELEAQYRVWGTLSEVANGRTGNRISLQRFVLGVLLDDVLIQASERLVRMSRGRYQLVRREDPSKGNRASGLELDVADTYTGKNRPVATLSGGESFMAALALALGLSDVVQAYAGGIQLDTLFIDEGFGSLDQDALDQAIAMLSELQMGGRMIGIISHVSELKEQMPVRVEVRAGRQGSTVDVKNPLSG